MAKGISLHIGLNVVDPKKYGGWDGRLLGCHNDAFAMQVIAEKLGYDTTVMLDDEATAARVANKIKQIAAQMSSGDIFFLTYSGHGGQVPDDNADEAKRDEYEVGEVFDQMDETYVLYDRQFVDDEMYELWSYFPAKSRIAVLSDSCHSGTNLRQAPWEVPVPEARSRQMPPAINDDDNQRRAATYRRIQRKVKPREAADVKATVQLISGCQDNQTSADGAQNGLFTQQLLAVYDDGAFRGSMRRLRDEVVMTMPSAQTPNHYRVGARNVSFVRQQAFAI
jgi:hypothetical protein